MVANIIVGAIYLILLVDVLVSKAKIRKLKARVLELEIDLYLYSQLSSQVQRKKKEDPPNNKVGTWYKK